MTVLALREDRPRPPAGDLAAIAEFHGLDPRTVVNPGFGYVRPTPDYGDLRLPERFWEKVYPCPITGCWLWGAATSNGYGRYSHKRKGCWAYGVAYAELVAPVAVGLELDHLCRVRSCVNPAHLEPVTHLVNLLRGSAPQVHISKTYCKYDHEFTPENTRMRKDGGRDCKECDRRRGAAYSRTEKGRATSRANSARYLERIRLAS